jgi:maltose-binding protein MalE
MFLKTTLLIFSAVILSCGTTEKQTQTTTTSETISETTTSSQTTEINEIMNPQKMLSAGYLLGTIVYSDKEGDCPYTIQMPGDKMEFYYLDPINLEEAYKKDEQKVWVKFNGLQRMNRCDKATPVQIVDMKKGE